MLKNNADFTFCGLVFKYHQCWLEVGTSELIIYEVYSKIIDSENLILIFVCNSPLPL